MENNKKTLAEKMYREIDIITGGEFDFEEDYDVFIKAFEKALYDYALVPTASIIE